jgi:hypothetical protein
MNLASAVQRRGVRAGLVGGVSVLAAASVALVLNPSGASAGGFSDPTTPHHSVTATVPSSTVGLQAAGPIHNYTATNATDEQCTSSTTYADMPGASVSFVVPGKSKRHVLAMFQGEWFNNDRALARVVVDGVVQSGPGDSASPVSLDSGNDAGTSIDQTNGFNFITDSLSPGVRHTLSIQWASVGGNSICVDERSLIVLRN